MVGIESSSTLRLPHPGSVWGSVEASVGDLSDHLSIQDWGFPTISLPTHPGECQVDGHWVRISYLTSMIAKGNQGAGSLFGDAGSLKGVLASLQALGVTRKQEVNQAES